MSKIVKKMASENKGISARVVRESLVPEVILMAFESILEGMSARIICDPWAAGGRLAAKVKKATNARRVLLCTEKVELVALGKRLIEGANWHVGEPLKWLESISDHPDIVFCALPYRAGKQASIKCSDAKGAQVKLRADYFNLVLIKAVLQMKNEGVGIFVIPQSFFFQRLFEHLSSLCIGIEAALELPLGTYFLGPLDKLYLITFRKTPIKSLFVGRLTHDTRVNSVVIDNLKNSREGGSLELGRLVEARTFRGLDHIRHSEWYEEAQMQFGAPALMLSEISNSLTISNLGRGFKRIPNSIFIPLAGLDEVVDSTGAIRNSRAEYAHVVIDSNKSIATFVATFMNSPFGRKSRQLIRSKKNGRKLSLKDLREIDIFVPDLKTQQSIIQIETHITREENAVRSIHNEILELRREIWSKPGLVKNISPKIDIISKRLSGGLRQHANDTLDEWIESLPFPLASILRSWQATFNEDYKDKYEVLLLFFEALAEFLGIIFISAFKSNKEIYSQHKRKLSESLKSSNLSIQRSTFGTWKLIVEYFGKRTRELLSTEEKQAQCAEIFQDSSLSLPMAISDVEIASILSRSNRMRNDWRGHTGVVGEDEAKQRNQHLLIEIERLRGIIANIWADSQLVSSLKCRFYNGVFENEVVLLMGSNSEFLKDKRPLSVPLDVGFLHIINKHSLGALQLIPLVRIWSSPQSAKNACYFFNRLDNDGGRFISFHFSDRPEIRAQYSEIKDLLASIVD